MSNLAIDCTEEEVQAALTRFRNEGLVLDARNSGNDPAELDNLLSMLAQEYAARPAAKCVLRE